MIIRYNAFSDFAKSIVSLREIQLAFIANRIDLDKSL